MAVVTRDMIVDGLAVLGLADRRIVVHGSLRSFGHVDGGAAAVVDAICSLARTVVAPTFTYSPAARVPDDDRIPHNGADYDVDPCGSRTPTPFTPDLPTAKPIGAIAEALRLRNGTVRSGHPLMSFAAWGEQANRYVNEHDHFQPLQPLERLLDDGGWVLMLGTGWTTCTTIHVGELLMGRRPFIRWALEPDGNIRRVAVSGCSEGFGAMECRVDNVHSVCVGGALIRFVLMQSVVDATMDRLRENPGALVCAARCRRCVDGAAGGPDIRD